MNYDSELLNDLHNDDSIIKRDLFEAQKEELRKTFLYGNILEDSWIDENFELIARILH